jgi:dCTP deaminase
MIDPFTNEQVRYVNGQKIVSYGLSSYGYDIRLADEFKVFSNIKSAIIDPKAFSEDSFIEFSDVDHVYIPPNSFLLARSMEYIRMPRNVTALMTNKSTYARCGVISPATILEAGWSGYVTIEISNNTPLPAKIYAGEGIAQLIFFAGEPCRVSYADRAGKYQGQQGITLPKV